MHWSARPFVRIVLIYITGIYLYSGTVFLKEIPGYIFLFTFFLLLIASIFITNLKTDIKYNPLKGLLFASLILSFAFMVSAFRFPSFDLPEEIRGTLYGNVTGIPAETENNIKAVVNIEKINDSILDQPFKALVYFDKENGKRVNYGDIVIFNTLLKTPEPPKNPGEFNYKRFLNLKGVEKIAFVKKNRFIIPGNNPANPIKYFAIKLRNKLLLSLKVNGITGKEFSVAAAMILGYDDLMDDEIRQNYQTAGAMHILCVSGLHVGIVYLVLNFLLGFLNKNKKQKIIKTILMLSAVWFYAFLTGLSPSVLRASVMVSFFIIGNEINRDKDSYNTLAMSAFFLLVLNPAFLFNTGFQLSYAAVLGIITFYKPFYNIFWIRNKFVDKIWSVISVSLAAQLGTFPLAIHYFNIFPTYFIITNLIVFPFSFLIISGGLLFIVVSWVPYISHIVATLISGMIYLMNFLVESVSKLPGSTVKDLYFPWSKVFIVYALIISLFLLISKKQKYSVFAVLFSVLTLISLQIIHKINVLKQNKILIYNAGKNNIAIDFIAGNKHVLLTDVKNLHQLEYHTEKNRIKSGLKKNYLPFDTSFYDKNYGIAKISDFVVFNGITLVLPGKKYFATDDQPNIDYLLITNKFKIQPDSLNILFNAKKVVLNDISSRNFVINFLNKKSIPFYDVFENGCLEINLNE